MATEQSETNTIYVTKYALTQGIIEIPGAEVDGNMAIVRGSYTTYYHKSDWHRTREKAVEHAEKMRVKKIASLRKQIERLEGLRFD